MNTKYQLIFIGNIHPLKDLIIKVFFQRIEELGLSKDSIIILEEANFYNNYISNAPTVCLYFGGTDTKLNIDILNLQIKDSSFVLPLVGDITNFANLVPETILPINGFELKSEMEVESLVSNILEGLSLLRLTRRLFISYKRNESRGVAIQLYERLEKAGFDVFLDTHSIRPGENFQDELWHRLVDTDVVVLLNTPDFLKSNWTTQELAKANSMSIGILQLIWPTHIPEREAEISVPFKLINADFEAQKFNDAKSYLLDSTIENIVNQVESLRARSLGARQDNIISEFLTSARSLGISANLQPEKFITIERNDGKEVVVIPTVGVPHAFTYNQSEELVKRIRANKTPKVFLLYDHRNIRERWLNHLSWLDGYLPISSIKITEIEQWLNNL